MMKGDNDDRHPPNSLSSSLSVVSNNSPNTSGSSLVESPPSSPLSNNPQPQPQQQLPATSSAWKRFGFLKRKKNQETRTTTSSPLTIRVGSSSSSPDLLGGSSASPKSNNSGSCSPSSKSVGGGETFSIASPKKHSNSASVQYHDLNDYLFSYDAVLENSESCSLFLQYLNEKRSPESLLFMMSVRKLRKYFNSNILRLIL
nr:unnamed protein product [Naegleria fowleri]